MAAEATGREGGVGDGGATQAGKRAGSLYLDTEVWVLLERKAKELRRSMSWLANESLRKDFGLPMLG